MPRPVVPKGKDKGKGKAKEIAPKSEVVYDYQDGSLHDLALRTHLSRGYDLFKVCSIFLYATSNTPLTLDVY